MRRDDDLYVLALLVEHNTKTTLRAAGSCIFLHVWEGPDKGMSGCTAMSRDALEELAAWLDRDAAVFVALPDGEYELLKRPWRLPLLAKPGYRRLEFLALTNYINSRLDDRLCRLPGGVSVCMRVRGLYLLCPALMLAVGCAKSTQTNCGPTQTLNDAGTCVEIPCIGGEIRERVCQCPEPLVLDPDEEIPGGGECVDPESPCLDFNCNDGNPCTIDECVAVDGRATCPFAPQDDGTACKDGPEEGVCISGECQTGPCDVVDCDDGNVCTFDGTCDPADGICRPRGTEPLGAACDQNDGKVCNGAGVCVQCNEGADCDDGNECTLDRCNESLCGNPNVEDDTACAGGEGVCLNGDCALICVSPLNRCANSTIEPFDPGECPIFPSSFNRCLGTESVVNPSSCASGANSANTRVFLIEVEDDCNSGRNLDGCDGNSCQLGSMAPGEGRIGVDNALSGLGPVLESIGENLGGVNKLLHDAICAGELDVFMNFNLNFPEGCATVQVRSGDDFGVPIAMNLSDTTPNCLSGTLGTFPFNFNGTSGELQNVVLQGTFFEGQLGGQLSGTADGPLIEALLEALGGHGEVAQSVLDIRTDLGPGECDALSLSLHFSAM